MTTIKKKTEETKSMMTVSEAVSPLGLNHLQAAALEKALLQAGVMRATQQAVLTILAEALEARPNPFAAKLSPLQAKEIRAAHKQGATYAELAREFGCSGQSVKRVVLGLSYAPRAQKRAP